MIRMDTRPMAGPLGQYSDSVKNGVFELANTGNYYVTPEMSRELKHITHGVEHVNLDQDFLATSREWAQKCGPERTHLERAGKSLTFLKYLLTTLYCSC